MSFGTLVTYSGSTSFVATRDISVDFGSGSNRAIIGLAYTHGSSAEAISSVVIDPAGAAIACTLGAEITTAWGASGARIRPFWLDGATVPTGVKTVRVTCAGANGKPALWAMPMSDITSVGSAVSASAGNSTPSVSLTGSTADVWAAFVTSYAQPDTSVMSPTSPSTLVGSRVLAADDATARGALWTRAGVASGAIAGSWSSPTPVWQMFGWAMTPAGPSAPTLTSPTGTAASSTSASIGVSTDTANGTLYRYVSTNATETAATVKASGTSSAVSASGAQGPFTASGLTSGLTYYAHFVHTNASAVDSTVSTAGPIYPGTWRPGGDVTVTGWTASGAGANALQLDEDTASDSDYITSPALSGSPSTAILSLDEAMPAGTYTLKVRARTTSGTGTLTVTALNDSNVSQGAAAPQAIDSTWTTYTLAITTTGSATRIKLDVTT